MHKYSTLDDSDLTSFLIDGDTLAYTEIYKRYHSSLYIHVFNKLRNREESRDIVHDLFIDLWQRRSTIKIKTSIRSYLYAGVRYKIFDLIARDQVKYKYLEEIATFAQKFDASSDHVLREKELTLIINKEIAALPRKMREIFELSRKEFLSNRQIAEHLNLSEATVKKQVSNSLKILKTRLGTRLFSMLFL
jgi:RNA polymerase sigma-70 factor (ECF subfamily)